MAQCEQPQTQEAYSDGATVSVAATTLDGATFDLSLTVDLALDHGEGGDAFAQKVRLRTVD